MDPWILPKRRGEHWIKQELEGPVQSWPRPSAQRGDLCESFLGMKSRQEAQPGGGCLRGQSWHLSGLGVVSARNDHMCSKPREQKQMKLSFLFLVHHSSMTHHCGLNKPHKLYLKSYLNGLTQLELFWLGRSSCLCLSSIEIIGMDHQTRLIITLTLTVKL